MDVEEQVTELVKQCDYVSIEQIRKYLAGDSVSFSNQTIKEYLHRLQNDGIVYDAGRGWYSTIEKEYGLNTDPIEDLIEQMDEQFPFLDFCVWSTHQIASHYHHVPTKFHHFIYTEKDTEKAVYDYWIRQDKNVYQNPRQPDQKHFENTQQTFIIRPSISKQPHDDHYALIEKILVDLYVEKNELNLLGEGEYWKIFEDVCRRRIQASKLISYADRRGFRDEFIERLSDFPPEENPVLPNHES